MNTGRINKVVEILEKRYPGTVTALTWKTPHQLLVATILSAQCTDERVNLITPGLFRKYRSIRAFSRARPEDMEQMVRSAGFFRNKTKHLIASSRLIMDEFSRRVPDTMENLVRLPGVSRKTANIVLSHVFGKAEGIAVDTHVKRIAVRLKWSKHENPGKVEIDLLCKIPQKHWLVLNSILVQFGREYCRARKPRCPECIILKYCPYK